MVPLTLEGSYCLHQMLRLRWPAWKGLEAAARERILKQAAEALAALEPSQSAAYSMVGHKADVMLVHFRRTMDELNQVEWQLARLGLWDYVELASSYVSVVELGLYETTGKLHDSLTAQGVEPDSDAYKAAVEEELARQRKAMEPRLYPAVPPHRYICFYPMDRKRGEEKNWYQVPFGERAHMMHLHGMIGRRYAGHVKQIITGSIGFDDWEWGVDLWSEDPLWFKKLIYEMRFDEVSAVYALFGVFVVGMRLQPAELAPLLAV
ncbi:MAG: heme-dependent peroxidase [Acidimicrobiia bacterium]|nr:heme-dependent peroxidase [Acidimicrobiia bacterium]